MIHFKKSRSTPEDGQGRFLKYYFRKKTTYQYFEDKTAQ